MIKYHIVYKEKEEDFYSTGKTWEVKSPEEALSLWRSEYPNTIFMALYPVK
jgi:hypothetical protein